MDARNVSRWTCIDRQISLTRYKIKRYRYQSLPMQRYSKNLVGATHGVMATDLHLPTSRDAKVYTQYAIEYGFKRSQRNDRS